MVHMSQPVDTNQSQRTTSAALMAVRIKSANKHIFRALLSLASATLLIRLVGLVQQIIITRQFGQTADMDAYYVAASIPVLLAPMLSGAIESAVIPVYMKIRTQGSGEEASRLFSTLLNILLLGITAFTLFMLLLRQEIIGWLAPGITDLTTHHLMLNLTPFIFPVLLFMVINSFLECLLNSEGQFGWPAYAGMMVPLTIAGFVLVGGNSYGVLMLCVGSLVGQIIQLAIIIMRAHHAHLTYRFVLDLHTEEMAEFWRLLWPGILGALVSQASPLIDQIFASYLSPGSIAVINNANKLLMVPVGVIFTSLGRAALPYLSAQATANDMAAFKNTYRLYLWIISIGTLLLTAAMILLAYPAIRLLFQHGKFTAIDTQRTATTLVGFCIGLLPMALGFFTSRAFTALKKARTLMGISTFAVVANALFDAILGRIWQSFGIALATSAVYLCNLIILFVLLHRELGPLHLLTPPHELLELCKQVQQHPIYRKLAAWKEHSMHSWNISHKMLRHITRITIIVGTFEAGIAGTLYNSLHALRIAVGAIPLLLLLRYRYALLLIWIALDALIGGSIPFFNGNNFLSGLIIPTLLLLLVVPIKPAFQRMPALPFLFAYLIWIFLSIGFSAIGISQFLIYWTGYIACIAIAVLMIHLLTTRKLLMGIIDTLLAQGVFLSLYGVYGYFAHQNGFYDTNIAGLYRIGSVFAAPPTLAFLLSLLIPLALYRTSTLSGWKVSIGLLCMFILLTATALTFTRATDLSVPLSLIVMICFIPSRRLKSWLLAGIVTLGTLSLLLANLIDIPLLSRFLNPDVGTLNGRTFLWGALLAHFNPAHLAGYGLHASDILLEQLQVGNGQGVIGTAPHNILLQALYDHGIIGLCLLLLVLIVLPWSLITRMRKTTQEHRMILGMALAVYINVVVQSMLVTVLWSQEVSVYVWMILTLPFVLYWKQHEGGGSNTSDSTTLIVDPEEKPSSRQEQLSHV
jgi:putative peptidoglycan lipid II flippase